MTINLAAGVLYDQNGIPLTDGKLIQLVASTTDLTFSSPTSTSFVSGDDVVIASFALDSNTFQAGGFVTAINVGSFTNLTAGDPLMLRWFNIDFDSGQTLPGVAFYGQFRTNSVAHSSDTGWFLPAGNGTIGLNFLTLSVEPDTGAAEEAGKASLSTSAVPEPSSYAALAGLAALGFMIISRRRSVRRARS